MPNEHWPAYEGSPDITTIRATFDIGAVGAVTKVAGSHPAITCTRNTGGTYDLTFPSGSTRTQIKAWCSLSANIVGTRFAARDPVAGTAQVLTLAESAGTIATTDPGNPSVLEVEVSGPYGRKP